MVNLKRVTVTTLLGLAFGVISWEWAMLGGHIFPWSGVVAIILTRTLMGFVIGISAWEIGWWLHGLLIGLLFGVPSGFTAIWTGYGWTAFAYTIGSGILFGFLIELITSLGFRAKMPKGKPKK